jgi:hypothetical protein
LVQQPVFIPPTGSGPTPIIEQPVFIPPTGSGPTPIYGTPPPGFGTGFGPQPPPPQFLQSSAKTVDDAGNSNISNISCDDSPDFKLNGVSRKNCSWISNLSKNKGKRKCQTEQDGVQISDFCPSACRSFGFGRCA